MIEKIGEYRKAIAAFLVPALIALGVALIADSSGVVAVTAAEWVGIAIAALGTSAVVTGVSNDTYTGGVN
jgi:long-subunit acyl-CoA synthetase (AMP-forming)